MSRVVFHTGKSHQEAAATWARRKLADRGAKGFEGPDDQDGVLFADGVGMGKTWEALSAAALILYEQGRERWPLHVLVLCPANLVTKWEDELAGGQGFPEKLRDWRQRLSKSGKAATATVVERTLTRVLPIRSSKHIRQEKRWQRFQLPGGTYIVSQTLFTRQGRRLTALRQWDWDVVIVDEAHSAAAQGALARLETRGRQTTKLLLSATPFQLEPRQWNGITQRVLKGRRDILNHGEVKPYVNALAAAFESKDHLGPTPSEVEVASGVFRRFVARTVPRGPGRQYALLRLDGTTTSLPARLDELDDAAVEGALGSLREQGTHARDLPFEGAYLRERFRLAHGQDRTMVATRLRRSLAGGLGDCGSPRLAALRLWAECTVESDLHAALSKGVPRKTIVFSSWVGAPDNGEAAQLQDAMSDAFERALARVRGAHARQWQEWRKRGQHRLHAHENRDGAEDVGSALADLASDELTAVMAGASLGFTTGLVRRLYALQSDLRRVEESLQDPSLLDFERRSIRRRVNDMRGAMAPWSTGASIRMVERYTGSERRMERDRVATAFRGVGPPWVLVASNVGSEGIDLQSYTARIVHYDLEWNPARMEQREGRGDRVGRKLKGPMEVLYCLVPRTYDERMFHQLVARDRWHGVLLGKPVRTLNGDDEDAPLVDRRRLERMRLDLRPR